MQPKRAGHLNLKGRRFTRLKVIGFHSMTPNGAMWICKCICGAEKVVSRSRLTSGDTKSCGCLHRDRTIERNYKHGLCIHEGDYSVWTMMRQRCNNYKNKDYKYYGGRGIKVCKRWEKFENFFADMGKRPIGMTLERINNNGDYKPSNCKWATWSEQRRNSRQGLSRASVIKIRKLSTIFPRKKLASMFNLTKSSIGRIVIRKAYAYVN